MGALDQLRDLGYAVDEAQAADGGPAVYHVAGPQVAIYVAADDYPTLRSLLNTHAERAAQGAA